VVYTGRVVLELVRGWNRRAEIRETRPTELEKLRLELEIERERNRALTSSTLAIGPPPPG
jgi:hypothetical protein